MSDQQQQARRTLIIAADDNPRNFQISVADNDLALNNPETGVMHPVGVKQQRVLVMALHQFGAVCESNGDTDFLVQINALMSGLDDVIQPGDHVGPVFSNLDRGELHGKLVDILCEDWESPEQVAANIAAFMETTVTGLPASAVQYYVPPAQNSTPTPPESAADEPSAVTPPDPVPEPQIAQDDASPSGLIPGELPDYPAGDEPEAVYERAIKDGLSDAEARAEAWPLSDLDEIKMQSVTVPETHVKHSEGWTGIVAEERQQNHSSKVAVYPDNPAELGVEIIYIDPDELTSLTVIPTVNPLADQARAAEAGDAAPFT